MFLFCKKFLTTFHVDFAWNGFRDFSSEEVVEFGLVLVCRNLFKGYAGLHIIRPETKDGETACGDGEEGFVGNKG